MAWVDVANSQSISCDNLQNAINTGIFTAGGTSIPSTDPAKFRQVVKVSASVYINVPDPDYAPYAAKTDNQLIVKSDIYIPGDFILDPQYGKRFTTMSGVNIPAFTYPVTTQTTTVYNGCIPSQSISVTVSGSAFVTPVHATLYVNSNIVDAKSLSNSGTDTISLNLPSTVCSPSEIKIAVDSGGVPAFPSYFNFSNQPVNNVAISKNTGQYQLCTVGLWGTSRSNVRFAQTQGYLCYSSDYGANFSSSSLFRAWSKVAISHNGQYALACEQQGYVWLSSNYGVTWTAQTSLGTRYWSGAAISSDGTYMVVTGQSSPPYTSGIVLRSTNNGSTWTDVTPQSGVNYSSVAMGGTAGGSDVVVTALVSNYNAAPFDSSYDGKMLYYYSTNYGATYTSYLRTVQIVPSSPKYAQVPAVFDVKMNPSASYAYYLIIGSAGSGVVTIYQNDGGTVTLQNETATKFWINSGVSNASIGSRTPTAFGCLQVNTDYYDLGGSADYLQLIQASADYITPFTSASSYVYQCVDLDNWSGANKYMLAGTTSGLYRSNDGGSTWAAV